MIKKLFAKLFGSKTPERYVLLELFGHVAMGACAVRQVTRYGKTYCEARQVQPGGSLGLPEIIGPGAIYRESEITKDEAIDRARPNWSPYPLRDPDPVCDKCGWEDAQCKCPTGDLAEEILPVPMDAIVKLIGYVGMMDGAPPDIRAACETIGKWFEQEQNDIPF